MAKKDEKTFGQSLGRKATRPREEYFPGRPADVEPTKAKPIPKGVKGESLGRRR